MRFLLANFLLITLLSGVGLADEQPNVLFIFADDQCYKTIHALNNEEIETPHLDSLARSGLTFTHAYNQGAWGGAVCVASRAMLNTGRFLWSAKQIHGSIEKERSAGRFWSEQMRSAGYETYFTGKWHVPASAEKAFDHVGHVRGGMPNQTKAGYNRPLADGTDPWSPSDPRFGGFWKGGKHWSEVVADDAELFFDKAAKSDKPFFMYLAFNAPHDPRQAPQEFVDKYPAKEIEIPASYLPEYPFKDAIGCGKGLRDEALGPFPRTKHSVQVHRQEYYAIITHMDEQIGRILAALEKSGKADNTWIFFSADHGLAVGNHGLFGKQNLYDHSVRVPLIVTGPGVAADTTNSEPVYLQDIMATTLDLADVEKPDYIEFQSLLPLIRDEKKSTYESVYGAYMGLQRSVIHDEWKLILYPKIKKFRLYHLATDPEELEDLAAEPEHQPKAKALFARYLVLQKQMGDALDLEPVYQELK